MILKLLMHILKKNKKLNIDNEAVSFTDIEDKFMEEAAELIEASRVWQENKNLENLKNIIRETFDVIQMCILILWRSDKEAKKLKAELLVQTINLEHKDKVITQYCWEPETGIRIEILK